MNTKAFVFICTIILATAAVFFIYWQFTDASADRLVSNIDTLSATAPTTANVIQKKAVQKNPRSVQQPKTPEELEEARKAYQIELYQRLADKENRTELEENLLANMLEANRYPPSTRSFAEPEDDPVARMYQQDVRSMTSENGKLSLTVWSDKNSFQSGDEIVIYAIVRDEIQSVAGNEINMPSTLRGNLSFNDSYQLTELTFSDDNSDLIYEAHISGTEHLDSGLYKVTVYSEYEIQESVVFALNDNFGEFTGQFRDSVVDGNLIIEIEVDVKTEGFYQIQASLYSSSELPIGNVEVAKQLASGKQWVPVNFYGKMIRDQGVDGPYLLKNLSLAQRAFPVKRSGLFEADYTTHQYLAQQFHNSEYNPLAQR